jgi:hypothetical protein
MSYIAEHEPRFAGRRRAAPSNIEHRFAVEVSCHPDKCRAGVRRAGLSSVELSVEVLLSKQVEVFDRTGAMQD